MYRNGANNNGRRAPHRQPPQPPQPQPQPQPQQDNYAFYQQPQPPAPAPAPNGTAMHSSFAGPQSPPANPVGANNPAFSKYGYDTGASVWYQPPTSPHVPAPAPNAQSNYSPSHNAHNASQFYSAQWESPQRQQAPPYAAAAAAAAAAAQNGANSMHQLPPTGYYRPSPPRPPQPPQYVTAPYAPAPTPAAPSAPFMPNLQNAVPLMMAGMQMASGAAAAAGNGTNMAQLGAQMLNTVAPGAAQQMLAGRDAVSTFMRLPKYYFMVNHAYVRRKLLLLLKPWGSRTWVRQRATQSDYLPPKDDVNAPDLYIPLMAFATYVLLAGLVLGTSQRFKPQALAQYLSKGAGVLTLEAVVIKLGLYLINAKATPWLDVIAYRGYKFVGVALTMAATLLLPKLYWPCLVYSASAMGLFLMRSHRRIVLPRDAGNNPAELARRNAFLLFLCALQYPVYWVLAIR